jgi:hypothetical protein
MNLRKDFHALTKYVVARYSNGKKDIQKYRFGVYRVSCRLKHSTKDLTSQWLVRCKLNELYYSNKRNSFLDLFFTLKYDRELCKHVKALDVYQWIWNNICTLK